MKMMIGRKNASPELQNIVNRSTEPMTCILLTPEIVLAEHKSDSEIEMNIV